MIILSAIEFKEQYPELWDNTPEYIGAETFYVSDIDTCPYIGVAYENGDVWVFGNNNDSLIDLEDLEWYLSKEA